MSNDELASNDEIKEYKEEGEEDRLASENLHSRLKPNLIETVRCYNVIKVPLPPNHHAHHHAHHHPHHGSHSPYHLSSPLDAAHHYLHRPPPPAHMGKWIGMDLEPSTKSISVGIPPWPLSQYPPIFTDFSQFAHLSQWHSSAAAGMYQSPFKSLYSSPHYLNFPTSLSPHHHHPLPSPLQHSLFHSSPPPTLDSNQFTHHHHLHPTTVPTPASSSSTTQLSSTSTPSPSVRHPSPSSLSSSQPLPSPHLHKPSSKTTTASSSSSSTSSSTSSQLLTTQSPSPHQFPPLGQLSTQLPSPLSNHHPHHHRLHQHTPSSQHLLTTSTSPLSNHHHHLHPHPLSAQFSSSQHHHHHHHHHHQQSDHINGQPISPRHVKKPLNAFMLFMKENRAEVAAESSRKESATINQILGKMWHELSQDEQAKYYAKAKSAREAHRELYPCWTAKDNYANNTKKKKKKREKTSEGEGSLKKCRARFGLEHQTSWCKPCRRKKKCVRFCDEKNSETDNL